MHGKRSGSRIGVAQVRPMKVHGHSGVGFDLLGEPNLPIDVENLTWVNLVHLKQDTLPRITSHS